MKNVFKNMVQQNKLLKTKISRRYSNSIPTHRSTANALLEYNICFCIPEITELFPAELVITLCAEKCIFLFQ